MRTDSLIEMLSTNVEPVRRGEIWRALALAFALGLVAAFGVMLLTIGGRPNISAPQSLVSVGLKTVFALIVIVSSGVALMRFAKPEGERLRLAPYLFPMLLALFLGGLIGLDLVTSSSRAASVIGTQPWTCVTCIPLFAILPFLALIFALRRAAPTDLRRTGAIAGLLAGGVGAVVYAFHCPDDSVLFVTVWYGSALAFCTLIGALLGPRFLRW
jgi:hypothetical protein